MSMTGDHRGECTVLLLGLLQTTLLKLSRGSKAAQQIYQHASMHRLVSNQPVCIRNS